MVSTITKLQSEMPTESRISTVFVDETSKVTMSTLKFAVLGIDSNMVKIKQVSLANSADEKFDKSCTSGTLAILVENGA